MTGFKGVKPAPRSAWPAFAGFACLTVFAAAVALGAGPAGQARRSEARALEALSRSPVSSETRDVVYRDLAVAGALRPVDARASARAAYVETLSAGRLTPRAEAHLLRTYDLEPLGPGLSLWRVGFVFDHWSEAGVDLRQATLGETTAIFPRQGWRIQARVDDTADARGRAQLAMLSARLRAGEIARVAPRSPTWPAYEASRPDELR